MKIIKHLLVAAVIVLTAVATTKLVDSESPYLVIFIVLSLGFFVFNLIVRKSLAYKNYFTSKYNLLTSKVWSEKVYDIPKELMFDKMIEVIGDSSFKLVDADKSKFEILAISKITFKSWGENIYISFETRGDETIMKFCSSTLFQVYAWGKNEKNFEELLNEIDDSLTV